MSDFRRACVLHQPLFFKNDVFIHIKNVKKELNVDSTNPSLKPKIFHANLLYTHWNTHRTKRIYSRRLGISYEETIHARDRHSITHLNNKHIYRKKLCNLSIRRSHNPRVSKAQETRFDRAKRRIFNTKEHNHMDLIQHKYATAQRYRFLFSETQFVLKPIKHLLYNQGLHHGNYKFWTPFFGRPGKRFMTTTINDTPPSLPLITYTVAPYNPTPNMFIPHKYRNIIPKEPLYTEEGVYIVPGSR
ncbi:14627_t:CDS:1, partial [Rhizophagus irregularis]